MTCMCCYRAFILFNLCDLFSKLFSAHSSSKCNCCSFPNASMFSFLPGYCRGIEMSTGSVFEETRR